MDVPVGKAPVAPSDETCVISPEHSALQRGARNLKIAQEQDTSVPQLGLFAPYMREIVFDLGAAVRSEWPWQGKNMKIQALNGNDIDVRHLHVRRRVALRRNSIPAWSAPARRRLRGVPRSNASRLSFALRRGEKFDLIAIDRKT